MGWRTFQPRFQPPWLEPAIDLAVPSTRAVAETLRRHHGSIHWGVPYGDVTGNADIDHMRANYAYGLLAGSVDDRTAPWPTRDLLLGFVIQAPGVMYPAHRHPAVEQWDDRLSLRYSGSSC